MGQRCPGRHFLTKVQVDPIPPPVMLRTLRREFAVNSHSPKRNGLSPKKGRSRARIDERSLRRPKWKPPDSDGGVRIIDTVRAYAWLFGCTSKRIVVDGRNIDENTLPSDGASIRSWPLWRRVADLDQRTPHGIISRPA